VVALDEVNDQLGMLNNSALRSNKNVLVLLQD
jgi:hypothetical protein